MSTIARRPAADGSSALAGRAGAAGEPEGFSPAAGERRSSWLWRFAAGQVLTRHPGPLDAGWLSWAPDAAAASMHLSGGLVAPRSRWARRPGLHRQLARLAALLAGAAFAVAPVLAMAAVAGAALACVAVAVGRSGAAAPSPEWATTSPSERDDAAPNGSETPMWSTTPHVAINAAGSWGKTVLNPLTSCDVPAIDHNNTRSRQHGMR